MEPATAAAPLRTDVSVGRASACHDTRTYPAQRRLLLISLYFQAHTKTVSETETPKIAAVNAALKTLFRTLDTKSGSLDPRIVAVAERQRDMQTTLSDRLSRWEHVRMSACPHDRFERVRSRACLQRHWVAATHVSANSHGNRTRSSANYSRCPACLSSIRAGRFPLFPRTASEITSYTLSPSHSRQSSQVHARRRTAQQA